MNREMSFRKAVFNLCKICAGKEEAITIRNLIHNMSVTKQTGIDANGSIVKPTHGDFAYIARDQNVQFLGYLLTDENVDKINAQHPFHITKLEKDERCIFEMAYITIESFISECLNEIERKYPNAVRLLRPYYNYRIPQMRNKVSSFLSKEDISECSAAFKNGKLYKSILHSNALMLLENVPSQTLLSLSFATERQLSKDLSLITGETKDYLLGIHSHNSYTAPEVLNAYVYFCYALRNALCISAQMLYESIIGCDMVVLNNDNLIKIENHTNDIVYEKYKVLSQDVFFGIGGHRIGSIALLECDPPHDNHIKEFGIIYAVTMNLIGEFGSSSKISLFTVDEELNPIHRMTDSISSTNISKAQLLGRK